ncbi:DUF2442 domain-containing protein [Rhodopseudomonas palustris]|uniref:DUF2442 domain-containing protein n=1 Tax=Thiospirillum jenense TaxID=1653858 RepID=A0A839HKA5_9GAMM|nr:DUF2442 domain-containing protein [Thiospirillum jenense]MBB1091970.1 DUF2442 domain-containing protein [Rhodopseudomonas palustris]MBB1126312.1 DUF2442 domain-containing protein [Thiospirillum jenense]
MIALQEAKYCHDFCVWLRFNTGEAGEVNLAEIVRRYPQAKPLQDIEQFRQFYLDDWPTLAWECGFDLSPELLYQCLTGRVPNWSNDEISHGD